VWDLDHSLSRKDKLTETDMAYEVLKDQGNPMHYHSLIEEVFRRLGISPEAAKIAAVLTQINLDTRFMFLGRGEWGLKAWEPSKISKKASSAAATNKTVAEDEDKSEADELDEDEELLDEEALESEETFNDLDEEQIEEKW
jgi:DNA-directed RNA polymerase subunit delta